MNANVRTFRAVDARAALSAVRAAFGGEAVILQTREIAGGLFGPAQIEVTAASSMDAAPRQDDLRGTLRGFPDPPATDSARQAELHPRATRVRKAAFEEVRPAVREAGAVIAASDLQSEVASLRRVVEEMRRRGARPEAADAGDAAVEDEGPLLTGEALRVYRHLLQRGVEEALARGLVEDARRLGAGRHPGETGEAVKAAMRKQLAPAPAPWLAERLGQLPGGSRRAIALVGPTGVGKTTAVAKIAARALLETSFKVGLVTVDAYRVGASDQLARYGRIMGLPTCVARDQAALAEAMTRFREADLVLIDTAGRTGNDALAAQTTLLRSVPGVQLHLVLSAATGGREMAAVARRYRAVAPERLIISKIDEADGPGGVYSAVSVLGRPISCVTDGQRVPEDIHAVTGPDLVDLVYGS